MVLAEYVAGKKTHDEFVRETMMFGRLVQRSVEMGQRSKFRKDVLLEEHFRDRDEASTRRKEEVGRWRCIRSG
jgi:hypothetical protein